MMKKALTLLMAAMLVMTMIGSAFAVDTKHMSSSYVDVFGYTTAEWFANEKTRAVFTVYLYMDYVAYTGRQMDGAFLNKKSFVARNGTTVAAFVPHKEDYLAFYYVPSSKSATYQIYKGVSASGFKKALDELGWKYYENDIDSIADVVELLAGRVSK